MTVDAKLARVLMSLPHKKLQHIFMAYAFGILLHKQVNSA